MNKYNEIYFLVINLYKNRRYKEVIDKVNKYLTLDFENDNYKFNMRFMKAKSLRCLGKFDEAITELVELNILQSKNPYVVQELLHIYYFLNRYKEGLGLLPTLYAIENKYMSNHSLSIMELVMRKHLGLPASFKRGTKSDYIKSQIVNYNEELALEHIKSHNRDEYSYHEHSRFNENVDVRYLLYIIKEQLSNSEKINIMDTMEIHYFAVSGIGYDENSICNYIKVVVCPNTNNIIAMYPFAYIEKENIKPLDCDMNKLFTKEEKESSNSRIDKFNRRFNLK